MTVHSFGYSSDEEVKKQFHQCMLNGELASICKVLCVQDSPNGHHSQENEGILEIKCDQCRRKLDTQSSIDEKSLDGLGMLEQHCLSKLYSDEFFWN